MDRGPGQMRPIESLPPARRLAALFFAVILLPAGALVWLGARLIQQDRALEQQRTQERLGVAADRVAAQLERSLAQLAAGLTTLEIPPGRDVVVVEFDQRSVRLKSGGPLIYLPVVPVTREGNGAVFAAGERLEFAERDYTRAERAWRDAAQRADPSVRAGALVRLGRVLRKLGRLKEALAVYEELGRLGGVAVGGEPAGLVARQARCSVLNDLKRIEELRREASALERDLQSGRWRLDRSTWQFHTSSVRRWLTVPPTAEPAAALAGGVGWVYRAWRDELPAAGRRAIWANGQPVLALWRAGKDQALALVAGSEFLRSQWRDAWRQFGVQVLLADLEGKSWLGQSPAPGAVVARTAAETGLPWTLLVTGLGPGKEAADLAGRRRLLLAGLALMAVLVLAGGYAIARSVTRELEVARLQSDFVSAVSHEFRTPLTSMRHLTELLETEAIADPDRRRQYYRVLCRETGRLHRLVENLLNFGRMEAGKLGYRFERLDPAELVRGVAAEFAQEPAAARHRIEVEPAMNCPTVRADREALCRALWNLLDNAVKYSPEQSSVWVSVKRDHHRVAISVRDEGAGVLPEEREAIFRKFVRGAASKTAGLKGSGIGLAMVQHIVTAHHGEIHLKSEPGKGSTFTILLPGEEASP